MRTPLWAVAAAAVGLGLLVWAATTEATVEYRSVAEARASARDVRLAGVAVPGSIERDAAALRHDFTLRDETGATLRVSYRGVPPDTFKDGAEVVATGRYDASAGVFRASDLLAKCPSKYEGRFSAEGAGGGK